MLGIHPAEIIILLITAFWLWMLVDCLLNKSLEGIQKVLWFFLILVTHVIGAMAYFIFGRSKRKVAYQPTQPDSMHKTQPRQSYSQGYQAQQAPSSHLDVYPTSPDQPIQEQYEQPRAVYPEQSQQNAR